MRARVWWRPLLLLTLASNPHAVHGQTSNAPRPPDLFVTRLQESQSSAQTAPARSTELPPLPATTLDDRQPGANLDGPRRISLTVSRPMPLGDLLLLLVNGTPFSLVDGEAVSGATFIGDLKDLTMRQAIEAVLFPRALDYDVQGLLIRVFPRRASTRLFNVNYPNTRRSLMREVRSSASLANQEDSSAILSSSAQSDLFDELEKGVQSLLSASGRMHVDRTAGLVQVTDFADRLDQVGIYVEAAQLRATRQVRIDAQVFEVGFADGGATSVDWRTPAIRSATATRPASAPGSSGVAATDIEALKKAIAQQGVITAIASPQLFAMNNEPAILRFGSAVDGLTLTMVAQISADGVVQMHVSPFYTARTGSSRSSDGTSSPLVRVNEADTLVRVQDGETIVLSGFLSEREKGGSAAPASVNQPPSPVRSELVILLTPTIVRSAGSPH
jgi:Bacterial type II and III secretion system protein